MWHFHDDAGLVNGSQHILSDDFLLYVKVRLIALILDYRDRMEIVVENNGNNMMETMSKCHVFYP